jgi:hypothetical protein
VFQISFPTSKIFSGFFSTSRYFLSYFRQGVFLFQKIAATESYLSASLSPCRAHSSTSRLRVYARRSRRAIKELSGPRRVRVPTAVAFAASARVSASRRRVFTPSRPRSSLFRRRVLRLPHLSSVFPRRPPLNRACPSVVHASPSTPSDVVPVSTVSSA